MQVLLLVSIGGHEPRRRGYALLIFAADAEISSLGKKGTRRKGAGWWGLVHRNIVSNKQYRHAYLPFWDPWAMSTILGSTNPAGN